MDVTSKFPALADGTRRAIFESLARSPQSVARLADGFPVSRPAVSQHLRVLQEAGLVRFRREGTRNVYEIDASGLADLRSYLDDLWSHALQDLKSLSESTYVQRGRRSQR
jgi:DNA-binding transcriptional ArsR family regulator